MSNELKFSGVNRSIEQIFKKILNLKNMYKKLHKPNATGQSPITWEFYDQVHEIMQNNHYFNQSNAIISDSSSENTSIPNKVGRKRKSMEPIQKLCDLIEKDSKMIEEQFNSVRNSFEADLS